VQALNALLFPISASPDDAAAQATQHKFINSCCISALLDAVTEGSNAGGESSSPPPLLPAWDLRHTPLNFDDVFMQSLTYTGCDAPCCKRLLQILFQIILSRMEAGWMPKYRCICHNGWRNVFGAMQTSTR